MTFLPAWARLPGPADFISAIVDDLRNANIVIVGLPSQYAGGVALEIAEVIRNEQLGAWSTVSLNEANVSSPQDSIGARSKIYHPCGGIIWVYAISCHSARSWIDYVNRIVSTDTVPRVCVSMAIASAIDCNEEKRLRRRLWPDFVTPTDSQVISERHCRQNGCSRLHTELKCAPCLKISWRRSFGSGKDIRKSVE